MAPCPHPIVREIAIVIICCSCGAASIAFARYKRKISAPAINSLPGKNCLVAALRRRVITLLPRAEHERRKARAETETWHRGPGPDLAAKRARPATSVHRVV
jgi:hypothetical protein